MTYKAFLTGSRVYGEPRPDSDVDLVIRADAETIEALQKLLGRHMSDYDGRSISLRCGDLNLHVCHTDKGFDLWKLGTRVLRDLAKTRALTRDEAIGTFRALGIDRQKDYEPKLGAIAKDRS